MQVEGEQHAVLCKDDSSETLGFSPTPGHSTHPSGKRDRDDIKASVTSQTGGRASAELKVSVREHTRHHGAGKQVLLGQP